MILTRFKNERKETPQEGFEHKIKGKCLRVRKRSRWEQRLGKMSCRRKEKLGGN
jgi:hypothetical protein